MLFLGKYRLLTAGLSESTERTVAMCNLRVSFRLMPSTNKVVHGGRRKTSTRPGGRSFPYSFRRCNHSTSERQSTVVVEGLVNRFCSLLRRSYAPRSENRDNDSAAEALLAFNVFELRIAISYQIPQQTKGYVSSERRSLHHAVAKVLIKWQTLCRLCSI